MAWDCCENPGTRCEIAPMDLADLPKPGWDGEAIGRKAAAIPGLGCVYLERSYWNSLTPDARAWVYFHEVGHLEGAQCEPCADRRAGEWVSQLGLAPEVGALLAIDAGLEHRPVDKALRAFHAGFGGRAGALPLGLEGRRVLAFDEQQAQGYDSGNPVAITLAEVRSGILVNLDDAADWDNFFSVLESWAIGYTANRSYATMEAQQAIWEDRTTDGLPNANWASKGPAARPGYSEHQMGRAVDLTFATDAGREQAAETGEQNGIFRTAATERWHFAHGGARRYPLASDPLGNVGAALGSSPAPEAAPPGEPRADSSSRLLWIVIPLLILAWLLQDK